MIDKRKSTRKRTSIMGTPNTLQKLKKIQGEIQAETGLRVSITDIMEEMSTTIDISKIKDQVIDKAKANKLNFRMRFDY